MEGGWSVEKLGEALEARDYLADRELITATYLALHLRQPLLLEGEAGVGKTELAKRMAGVLERPLFRVQCYEGIDRYEALYDWDYQAQLLESRRGAEAGALYGEEFLLEGPVLGAERPAVLLVDEIDRSDEEFEAFLLEMLGELQVTIPHLGTLHAVHPPLVVLTSNRTRDLHDALKRRCLYQWIDFPDREREREIVERVVPEAGAELARRIATAADRLRAGSLYKPPGIGESISWAQALVALGTDELDQGLAAALKVREDLDEVKRTVLLKEI
jgi:MoxR-like ATPase